MPSSGSLLKWGIRAYSFTLLRPHMGISISLPFKNHRGGELLWGAECGAWIVDIGNAFVLAVSKVGDGHGIDPHAQAFCSGDLAVFDVRLMPFAGIVTTG